MAYLCEKYAQVDGLPKYDPKHDPAWGRNGRAML